MNLKKGFSIFTLIGCCFISVVIITENVSFNRIQSTQPNVQQTDLCLNYTIVDTAQNITYDETGKIISTTSDSSYYGQDANYRGNTPNYRDNGNGTILDLNSGLMWQQDPGSKLSWNAAWATLSTFNLGGYSDWRIPTIKELYSLILFNGTDISGCEDLTSCAHTAFIDTNFFTFSYGNISAGERYIDSQYLSSTKYVSTTMNGDETVFGVNFADGRIKGYPLVNNGVEKNFFVIYVRGNPNYGINNFIENSDSTVSDTATGLTWAKNDSGIAMTWSNALAWVRTKNAENYLGHNDWRLPNAKELQSIVDYSMSLDTNASAAINLYFQVTQITDEGGNINFPFFWTSTTHATTNSINPGAYAAYLAFGEALGWMKNLQGIYTLLDVHGAGAQRSDPKLGDSSDYPYGHGPQGDVIRIENFVRLVREGTDVEVELNVIPQPTPDYWTPIIIISSLLGVGVLVYTIRTRK